MVKLLKFGPYLRARRRAAGMSLDVLAKKSRISGPTLSRLENDKTKHGVTVADADRLARSFGDESTLSFLNEWMTPWKYRIWVKDGDHA